MIIMMMMNQRQTLMGYIDITRQCHAAQKQIQTCLYLQLFRLPLMRNPLGKHDVQETAFPENGSLCCIRPVILEHCSLHSLSSPLC